MLKIGLIVYPHFQSFSLSVASVFEYANLLSQQKLYDFQIYSDQGGFIHASYGITVDSAPLLPTSDYDTLIISGDYRAGFGSDTLISILKDISVNTRRMASVCSGAFLLAKAGLLKNKRVTTHWLHAKKFRQDFPDVILEEDKIFIIDDNIWTSAGMSAGIDLALAMVENDFGQDLARNIARKLVLYHRRGSAQSQFSALLDLDAKTDRIQKTLAYAKENINGDLSVETLAQIANLSPRQFSRIFRSETGQSPAKAIEQLRVEEARMRIETTMNSLEIIARETGFGDRERMRQAFLRAFDQSPQTIQRIFHQ
ncbi:helix-turn-helix domain-containing protein [Proteus sp. G2659]|uniref:GlxA family transcriptional regulator n=1 Tax=Proteus sp. G2659 TaxID=2698872 RepID=UPI0013786FEB|nr:GlxA family transcriptional regulator [Proteus sp. G2659]NBM78035.1 helix-turn-helix domain-containing protein [Proteus sp. G2659]